MDIKPSQSQNSPLSAPQQQKPPLAGPLPASIFSSATEEMDERESRDLLTRDYESRTEDWKPPSLLPDPPSIPGVAHRWIRKSTLGEIDPTNMQRRQAEGWHPCSFEEYAQIMSLSPEFNVGGHIESGGLMLARASEQWMEKRDKFYNDLAHKQIRSVNQSLEYMRQDQERSMPLFREQKRTVTVGGRQVSFGSGE